MSMTDNEREHAARLGGGLFLAALYAAQATYLRDDCADMTACAAQGALRALLSMELGERANIAASAILTAARARVSLEGDTDRAKSQRVTFALLDRVDWSAQRPLTLALVITTPREGAEAFVVWLASDDGALYRAKPREGEAAAACAERLRFETLGTIGEVTSSY